MSREISGNEKEKEFIHQKIEVNLESEDDLDELKELLLPILGEDGSEQCIFVLKSTASEDYVNQCNKATQGFGKKLNTRFGEEESFFEIMPESEYYDVRSEGPFKDYKGDFHSVGLLEFDSEEKEKQSLIFDLTYDDLRIGKEGAVLIVSSTGSKETMLNYLDSRYGGIWKVSFTFDKEKETFFYSEK